MVPSRVSIDVVNVNRKPGQLIDTAYVTWGPRSGRRQARPLRWAAALTMRARREASHENLFAVDAPATRRFHCWGCLPVVRERALRKVPEPGRRGRAAALIAHGGQRPIFRAPSGLCYVVPDRRDVDA